MTSMIISSHNKTENDLCEICWEPLKNSAVTHEGGENHAYHKTCLKRWLKISPTCPNHCGARLPPNGLDTRIEKITRAAGPYLESARKHSSLIGAIGSGFGLAHVGRSISFLNDFSFGLIGGVIIADLIKQLLSRIVYEERMSLGVKINLCGAIGLLIMTSLSPGMATAIGSWLGVLWAFLPEELSL